DHFEAIKRVYRQKLNTLEPRTRSLVDLMAFELVHEAHVHTGQLRRRWLFQGNKAEVLDPRRLLTEVKGLEPYWVNVIDRRIRRFEGSNPYSRAEMERAMRLLVSFAPDMLKATRLD